MVLLVKVLAIAMIVYGCMVMLRPAILKKVMAWVKEGNNLMIISGIKVAIGVLLMIASTYCSVPWVILFFGAVVAFGSAVTFVIKRNFVMELLEWVDSRPAKTVYVLGLVFLGIGAVLALAA